MSARSRAKPWFGSRGERYAWPQAHRFTPAPVAPRYMTWAPGEREKAAARGVYLDEPAFITATQALLGRARAQVEWWRHVDPVGVAAYLGEAPGGA